MSHLLSRLADRALGIAPAIEPVRAPIFDSEPGRYAQAGEGESAGFAYGAIFRGARASLPASAATAENAADTVNIRAEQWGVTARPAAPAPGNYPHEPAAAERDESYAQNSKPRRQAGQPAELSVSTRTGAESGMVFAPDPGPGAPALAPVAARALRSDDGRSPAPVPEAQAGEAVSGQSASPDIRAEAAVESTLRPRDSAAAAYPAQPGRSGNLPPPMQDPQNAAPTIRVTIGRIDVRAVTAPPAQAPRPARKAQPSLSLDDYLKQRAGDRR